MLVSNKVIIKQHKYKRTKNLLYSIVLLLYEISYFRKIETVVILKIISKH